MIKVSNISVMNFDNAIRGMRNPLNSWDKSDSYVDETGKFHLGDNDLKLAMKLANAGSDDRKFLRQIIVSVDILAPFYWWKEFDTYKVGTVANSCSTMHRIHAKDLTIDDFSHEHLNDFNKKILEAYIDTLNFGRKEFVDTKDKAYWWQIIQMLPSSYNQLRTVTLNYEVLKNMYRARKHHKLDEWRELCKFIEMLPYSELITGEREDKE